MSLILQTCDADVQAVKDRYEELIAQFITCQDVTKGSRTTYRNALRQFFAWLVTEQNSAAPDRDTILRYKEYLDGRGLRPFTRSNYLVAIRRFFEWAESYKLYPNIAKGVKGIRRSVKSHHKNALTIEQIQLLLESIDRTTLQGIRDYALINLLIRTGLRLIEIKMALVEDMEIAPDGTAVLWIRGKGRAGKDDFVYVTTEAIDPIIQYLKERPEKSQRAPLFASVSDRNYGKHITINSLSRLIKSRLRAAGINNRRITAHSLRHTFGVLAISAGASLYEVQLAMRHTSPATTEVYLGDIEQKKRMEGGPERLISNVIRQKK